MIVIVVSTLYPPVHFPAELIKSLLQRISPGIPGIVMDHKIPIWLDCDPGHDDVPIPSRGLLMYQAFALLYATYSPYLELIGKTSWTTLR